MEEPISARTYHRSTCYQRNAMRGGFLDWAHQPTVYKRYHGLQPVALPACKPRERPSFDEVLGAGEQTADRLLTLDDIACVASLSYGITAVSRHAGGEFHYRSAPSAGALYPCELYVALRDVAGLEDGVYHYQVQSHALVCLRQGGGWTTVLSDEIQSPVGVPQCVFFISAIFNRSSWKYRERSYRYLLLDSGHLLENVVLALRSVGSRPRLSFDFSDRRVNVLLGFDPAREVTMALIGAGRGSPPKQVRIDSFDLRPVQPEASVTSEREAHYPVLQAIHQATSEPTRQSASQPSPCEVLGLEVFEEIPLGEDRPKADPSFDEVLQNRRSRRNFISRPMDMSTWITLLRDLCGPNEGLLGPPSPDATPCVGFAAQRLENLDDGFYLLETRRKRVRLVKRGHFLERSASCCLEQGWLAGASLHVFFISNLDWSESLWGPRIYRHILMTAGRLGERLYLRSTALRLGVCGIGATFDDELSTLLGLNKSSMVSYLMGIGMVKKRF